MIQSDFFHVERTHIAVAVAAAPRTSRCIHFAIIIFICLFPFSAFTCTHTHAVHAAQNDSKSIIFRWFTYSHLIVYEYLYLPEHMYLACSLPFIRLRSLHERPLVSLYGQRLHRCVRDKAHRIHVWRHHKPFNWNVNWPTIYLSRGNDVWTWPCFVDFCQFISRLNGGRNDNGSPWFSMMNAVMWSVTLKTSQCLLEWDADRTCFTKIWCLRVAPQYCVNVSGSEFIGSPRARIISLMNSDPWFNLKKNDKNKYRRKYSSVSDDTSLWVQCSIETQRPISLTKTE